MRRLSAIHWLLICAAALCTVLLSFVSTVSPGGKRPQVAQRPPEQQGPSLDEQIATARRNMASPDVMHVDAVLGSILTDRDPVRRGQMYDSLARFLAMKKQYVYSAWIAEQKAIKNNGSGSDWEQAGERYHSAAAFSEGQGTNTAVYEAAMRCFNKALELEPNNPDAKVGLGICIVESTNDPMKGVSLLLEVERTDSTNVNAQLALADFGVRSQQYDKAIGHYTRALQLKPEYYGLHLNLAELYEAKGDTAAAISHLEEYVKVTTDPVDKTDIENAIRRLKSGRTNK